MLATEVFSTRVAPASAGHGSEAASAQPGAADVESPSARMARLAPCEERDYTGLHAPFPSNITRDDPPITRDCPPSLLTLQGSAAAHLFVPNRRTMRTVRTTTAPAVTAVTRTICAGRTLSRRTPSPTYQLRAANQARPASGSTQGVLGSWVDARQRLRHSLSPTRILHGF